MHFTLVNRQLFLRKELFYDLNAALSGQKQWVKMCSEAKRNPLFLFRLNALLYFYTLDLTSAVFTIVKPTKPKIAPVTLSM